MEIINIVISSSGLLGFGLVLYLRYKNQIKLGLSFDKWAVSESFLGIGIAARFLVLTLIIGCCKWLRNYNSELVGNQYSVLPKKLTPVQFHS